MDAQESSTAFFPLPGAVAAWEAGTDAASLLAFCRAACEAGGRLVTLWACDERDRGEGFSLHIAIALDEGLGCLHLPLAAEDPSYPDLSAFFPAAARMQRAQYDLLGVRAVPVNADDMDPRPWLRHAGWPADFFPLRRDTSAASRFEAQAEDYPFVRVEGDGVHEIPVGPIHAGIIEPGHFRFSVVGEKVLRLEQRLGFKHKGIDKRFESMALHEGYRLAGRVSGDSTVAYAWAYCMALEGLTGCPVPDRALWLRGLMLERERVANHLGDLGYLGNDAALAFGLSQFMRLKEDWLRLNHELFGHRFMMDRIVPGGAGCDIDDDGRMALHRQCNAIEREVALLREIYDDHSGLQDRFLTTGRVTPELAASLGLVGLAGRASDQGWDLRVQHPVAPYDMLEVRMKTQHNGDVAARAIVRFNEIFESLRIIRHLADHLPPSEIRTSLPAPTEGALGIGWVEGWRGEVFVALQAGTKGMIRRCHCHDPSWHNWPVLEHAIMGNIVPDFPLINKSFNLSYSGHDL
jgi:Ni,Fe-hydrogenase III large subunit/Ni,Fe-hydrogenase III component G